MVHPEAERVEPRFVGCSAAGCTATSARAEYDSMMLRIGFSNCCKHLDISKVESRVQNVIQGLNESKFTLIFYALGLSRHGEIEQLSAFSERGDDFSAFIRTAVRVNTSPNLKAIPPLIYSALASEPLDAMSRFIQWIRTQHSMNTGGDSDMNNVILAAHFGSCHDHVFLLRTMMSLGITPPAADLPLGINFICSQMNSSVQTADIPNAPS
ncbi:hypothetical protein N7451_012493 [Penicillium sp. IBT 35674x]|nr:hypothetical protein N7451_012493 [Penicillium sp. IBT 35674x]